MSRITITSRRPLNNGTWVALRNGSWGNADLRLVPYHLVEFNSIEFHNLAAWRPISLSANPSMHMVLPRYFNIGGSSWRGRMIIRADDGSPDRVGSADVMHDGVPWVFLRAVGARSPLPWVQGLDAGREAWFTTDGRDLREICSRPVRDRDGLLIFDVLGDVRVGNVPTVVVGQLPAAT